MGWRDIKLKNNDNLNNNNNKNTPDDELNCFNCFNCHEAEPENEDLTPINERALVSENSKSALSELYRLNLAGIQLYKVHLRGDSARNGQE